METNKVKRNCPLFNDNKACKKVQKSMNCYQCKIANCELYEKENERLKRENRILNEENTKLKMLLGEKELKEHDQ